MLEIGSIIDGKYKILNKIGQGGMSVVYLAMNERANKQWAIKEVRKDGVKDYEVVKQGLIAETDILKRLNHPNLPSIIDVIDREDTFLIVMDYIEGRTLDYWLKKEGAQPQERVVEWAKQICDVLGYLHSRKPPIIYRDLKPANVMLKPDGQIEIIDFGTAREFKETSIEDTSCLGTQGYAAPEQYGGHGQTDGRTDIYTLGATMYHLLTGHNPSLPPYEMYPIRQWNPALSSGLEQIVIKCTQRNPADRYQSCAELMYALEHYNELDIEYKKKQSRKWRGFIASCALAGVSLVGCLGFRFAETTTTNNSYDEYIKAASISTDQNNMITNYENAIDLDPTREEGYMDLLKKVYLADDEFSQEEAGKMTQILGSKRSGNRSNESFLESNEKAYAEFAFQLGLAYYYYYGDGGKQMSQTWFDIAYESDQLKDNQSKRAEILGKIAGYWSSLNKSDRAGDATTSDAVYWKDMTELIDGNLVEMDNAKTALVMYQEVVYQISTNTLNFKTAGVTQAEMESQLDKIESRLQTDFVGYVNIQNESDNEIEGMIATISGEIDNARRQVEIAFSSLANGSSGTEGGTE